MANVQKRPNGKWRARYRDLDGKEHARHFDRKLDAQRWLDEVTASVVTGQYVDPRAGKISFEKYATKWEAEQIAGEAGTRITDSARPTSAPDTRAWPVHDGVPAADSHPGPVQGALRATRARQRAQRLRGLGPGHGGRRRGQGDSREPLQADPPPAGDRRGDRPPTIAQVEAMSDAMPPYIRVAIVVLAGSGLRPARHSRRWKTRRRRARAASPSSCRTW